MENKKKIVVVKNWNFPYDEHFLNVLKRKKNLTERARNMKSSVGQMGHKTFFSQNLLIASLVLVSLLFNGLSAKVK